MFDLISYYNCKTNKRKHAKEYENGKIVFISKRRFIKFAKGIKNV